MTTPGDRLRSLVAMSPADRDGLLDELLAGLGAQGRAELLYMAAGKVPALVDELLARRGLISSYPNPPVADVKGRHRGQTRHRRRADA